MVRSQFAITSNRNQNNFWKIISPSISLVIHSLIKEESNRPKYSKLLQHPFIQRGEKSYTDVAAYVVDVLETMACHGITPFTTNQPAESWYDD